MKEKLFKKLLSLKETAEYLGISARTLYNQTGPKAINKFPVQPKRVGKLLKFDLDDINRYLDSL